MTPLVSPANLSPTYAPPVPLAPTSLNLTSVSLVTSPALNAVEVLLSPVQSAIMASTSLINSASLSALNTSFLFKRQASAKNALRSVSAVQATPTTAPPVWALTCF